MLCFSWIRLWVCVCEGGWVSSCEGVASCSLCCSGHKGTQGVFLGSWSSYIPDSNAQMGAIFHLQCFACVTYPQSFKHNVPETLVLIKAAGVTGQRNMYQCPPCAVQKRHLPASQKSRESSLSAPFPWSFMFSRCSYCDFNKALLWSCTD